MSKATKRKYVVKEVTEKFPEPKEEQDVVRVVAPRGNNLHECEWPDGSSALVSMPTKFRGNVWIKRGDYLIVDPIVEGDKVRAEIVFILQRPQIRHLRKIGQWPFNTEEDNDEEPIEQGVTDLTLHSQDAGDEASEVDSDEESSDDPDKELDQLFGANPNRPHFQDEEEDDDTSDSEGEDNHA